MELAIKILITYAVISFVAGAFLMVVDVMTVFRFRLETLATVLYLPPLGLGAAAIVSFLLYVVWTR